MQTFECSLCGIEVSFDYKGRTPPYEKGIVYVPARHFDDYHPPPCVRSDTRSAIHASLQPSTDDFPFQFP